MPATASAARSRASVANPNLGATYYGYDALGRRTCAADRGGTAKWEYDPANGKGLLKRRSYDRDTVLADLSSCAFGGEFTETYTYNTDARLTQVQTSIIDDANATTALAHSYAYDDYGRPSSTTYPSSVTVKHEYNDRGYVAKLKHGTTTLVNVTAQTAHGQSKAVTYGNGARTERSYDALGRLKGIDTARNAAAKIQDNAYAWRSDGSLERRTANAAGGRGKREESFDYDYLNRLERATTRLSGSSTASRTLAFDYDPRGNLKTKTSNASADKSTTGYDYFPGTNRLREATIGDVDYTFAPDTSGHITHYACTDPDDTDQVDPCADVDDTFIDWNARGLAEKVTVGESADAAMPTARDSFHYGPDGARYFKKSEWAVESGNTTTMKTSRKYYAGAYEKTATVGGDTVERVRIGDSVVHVRTTPAGAMATATSAFEYAHRDHLGSVEAVTDASGNELVVLGHDPYGERRKPDWTRQLTKAEIEALLGAHGERASRGFTRHEHLDRTGLIHMNGRMYDPRLGRFLSPDPIVGDVTSSQSWNLYSYARNNPLSYVDPTGQTAQPIEEIVVTGCRQCWSEWWWVDHLFWWGSSSEYSPVGRWDFGPGYDPAEMIRADAEQTLLELDKSIADQPMAYDWTREDIAAFWASKRVFFDDTGGMLNEVLEKVGMKYDPQDGFAAVLYKINGRYYLAFRGTEILSLRDWVSNGLQALGFGSSQFRQAIALARAVFEALEGNVTFVGISKGGGLASAARFSLSGSRAITFDSSGLHRRYRTNLPGEIRAHYNAGDPLSLIQDFLPFLPKAVGTRIKHPIQFSPFWRWHGNYPLHFPLPR